MKFDFKFINIKNIYLLQKNYYYCKYKFIYISIIAYNKIKLK